MKGIVADVDILGHWQMLIRRLLSDRWREIWAGPNLQIENFQTLGLRDDAEDAAIWHVCQQRQVILITGNRNQDGPDSLEATIRSHNTPASLPVFTLADSDRILKSKVYAERVTEQLLQYLLDIDNLRGTGRLFLP